MQELSARYVLHPIQINPTRLADPPRHSCRCHGRFVVTLLLLSRPPPPTHHRQLLLLLFSDRNAGLDFKLPRCQLQFKCLQPFLTVATCMHLLNKSERQRFPIDEAATSCCAFCLPHTTSKTHPAEHYLYIAYRNITSLYFYGHLLLSISLYRHLK